MDYSERVENMYCRSAYIHLGSGLPKSCGMVAFFYELDDNNAYMQ